MTFKARVKNGACTGPVYGFYFWFSTQGFVPLFRYLALESPRCLLPVLKGGDFCGGAKKKIKKDWSGVAGIKTSITFAAALDGKLSWGSKKRRQVH